MAFPAERPRRVRDHPVLREMVAEPRLAACDLVMPLFVRDGGGGRRPIARMPGQWQHTLDTLVAAARETAEADVKHLHHQGAGAGDSGLDRSNKAEMVAQCEKALADHAQECLTSIGLDEEIADLKTDRERLMGALGGLMGVDSVCELTQSAEHNVDEPEAVEFLAVLGRANDVLVDIQDTLDPDVNCEGRLNYEKLKAQRDALLDLVIMFRNGLPVDEAKVKRVLGPILDAKGDTP